MARAYVIRIADAEFRIFGNKTEVAELLLTLARNTTDAMTWRGYCNNDYWESEECHDMANIVICAEEEAKRIAPDYCGK